MPEELGRPDYLVVDTGDCSNDNLRRCEAAGLTPLIAMKRDAHHAPLLERFAPDPDEPLGDDPMLRLQHRLATRDGKGLYARRKITSEPVFGVIKHVLGFRQSLPRGLTAVSGEWNLVNIAWNLRWMHTIRWRGEQAGEKLLETVPARPTPYAEGRRLITAQEDTVRIGPFNTLHLVVGAPTPTDS